MSERLGEPQAIAAEVHADKPSHPSQVGQSPSPGGELAALLAENHELTKALTGLTCGGSEFFVRRGNRYVADIPACVEYVNRLRRDAHRRVLDLHSERLAALDGWVAAKDRAEALEAALKDAALNLDACAVAIKKGGKPGDRHVLVEGWAERARAALLRSLVPEGGDLGLVGSELPSRDAAPDREPAGGAE